MRAKVIATDASSETGICHFTFETTMKEAATIGSFSPDDEFYIEKSAKNVATFPGKVVGMFDGSKSNHASRMTFLPPSKVWKPPTAQM